MTGGSAASGGFSFQDKVAGFLAVHILGSRSVEFLKLPERVVPTEIQLETVLPVDDILVRTDQDGRCFFNVKSTVANSRDPQSPLGLALDQFVKLWIECRDSDGSKVWRGPLSPKRDRLVLITGIQGSTKFATAFASILARIADQESLRPVDAIAITQVQKQVYATVLLHLRTAYQRQASEEFPDEEMANLLCLVRVKQLELDDMHKSVCLSLLENSVIESPGDAERAWSIIVENCQRMASIGSGAKRSVLRTRLSERGVRLAGSPDIQSDIRQLKRVTRRELESIAYRVRLEAPTAEGPQTIEIQRSVTQVLTRHARGNSILVTGEPGSGKSGAIYSAAQQLISNDDPVVVLTVDRHPTSSLESLMQELGLENGLVDILRDWPGTSRGVLFIDALDASRGGPTDTVFQDLIRRTIREAPNWNVVASIRAFDLRLGVQYRHLFRGSPLDPEYSNSEFGNVRHLSVPKLTNKELEQVWLRSPAMEEAYRDGTKGLRELLRSPFNLFLLADVLLGGSYDLTQVSTQVELLHLYWSHRVIGSDGQNIARQRALRAALDKMLDEHQLSVAVDAVPAILDSALNRLLSEGVLSPVGGHRDQLRRVSFSHHVLLDYAVARLILEDGKALDLASRLTGSEDDALMMAPASIMAFQILWGDEPADRSEFWFTALKLAGTKEAGAFCRMLPAHAAVGLVESLEDFQPVLKCMASSNDHERGAASFLVRHCIGALTTGSVPPKSNRAFADPWPCIAEALTRVAIADARWMLKPLIARCVESASSLNKDEKRYIGTAARRMLEYSVGNEYDEFVVGVAVQGIARMFGVAPQESLAALTLLLHPDRVAEHGHNELSWLIREFNQLLRHVPVTSRLIGDVYRAAFCTQIPAGEEAISLTGSRILNLTSTRAQDFEHARYRLVESLPLYFKASPESATETLVDLAECFFGQRLDPDEPVETLVVSGVSARYVADRSCGRTWESYDGGGPPLQQFQSELVALADDGRIQDVAKVLGVVIQANRLASVWAAILRAGTRRPDVIGTRLLDLVTAKSVLEGVDTQQVARDLLLVLHPLLDDFERRKVEQAVLDLEERARRIILSRISLDKIVTDDLRSQKRDLGNQENPPPSQSRGGFRSGSFLGEESSSSLPEGAISPPHDEDWWLREQGVDLTIRENAGLRKMISVVEQTWKSGGQESIDLNSAQQGWPYVVDLLVGLESRSDIPIALSMSAWNALATAAAGATRAARDAEDLSSFPGLIEIVLGALTAEFWPRSVNEIEREHQFAEHQGWELPAPRVEGARALMGLCRIAPTLDLSLDDLAVSLARDPFPAVRMQVLQRAVTLRESNESLMWRLFEIGFSQEENAGVMSRFLAWIAPALKDKPEWFSERLIRLEDRLLRYRSEKSADRHHRHLVDLLIRLWLVFDQSAAGVRVRAWIADPVAHDLKVQCALFRLRTGIVLGDPENPDPVSERVRAGAIEVFHEVTQRLASRLSSLPREPDRVSAEEKAVATRVLTILDFAAAEIYFGSGAHAVSKDDHYAEPVRIRFLQEMEPTLGILATVACPGVTHRLLEALETFIGDDPRLVFRLVTDALSCGGPTGGYQFEKMGLDLFLRIVGRYLAEYRGVLNSELGFSQRLMKALDEFVEAGWPRAIRLAYELPEDLR